MCVFVCVCTRVRARARARALAVARRPSKETSEKRIAHTSSISSCQQQQRHPFPRRPACTVSNKKHSPSWTHDLFWKLDATVSNKARAREGAAVYAKGWSLCDANLLNRAVFYSQAYNTKYVSMQFLRGTLYRCAKRVAAFVCATLST